MNRYAESGVSIAAGDRAVQLMREWVDKATRPEVVGGIGGFAGLFDATALGRYTKPLLATSADGVGTKVAIAQALDKHDTIGYDLVGMLVDDLVVCGAEPLFMTDYIACGRLVPERIASIVKGIAEACVEAGCALLGGETAEHPGLLRPDEYDVAGSTTGVVEASAVLGADKVRPGDALLAMRASGLHANGYSLVRHTLTEAARTGASSRIGSSALGWMLERHVDELGRSLGEELLEPTRIYASSCLELIRRVDVHAMAHVTGGGLAANLARVLPSTVVATVHRSSWTPQPIFGYLDNLGNIGRDDLETTLNMGVGMLAVIPDDSIDVAVDAIRSFGIDAWQCGSIKAADGAAGDVRVALVGEYRGW